MSWCVPSTSSVDFATGDLYSITRQPLLYDKPPHFRNLTRPCHFHQSNIAVHEGENEDKSPDLISRTKQLEKFRLVVKPRHNSVILNNDWPKSAQVEQMMQGRSVAEEEVSSESGRLQNRRSLCSPSRTPTHTTHSHSTICGRHSTL